MEEGSTFAKRLREAREAIGISQKQLGILAGIDQFVASARINQYERGKHVPDIATARRLASELGIPVSFLYEPNDDLAALIRILGRIPKAKLDSLTKQLNDE